MTIKNFFKQSKNDQWLVLLSSKSIIWRKIFNKWSPRSSNFFPNLKSTQFFPQDGFFRFFYFDSTVPLKYIGYTKNIKIGKFSGCLRKFFQKIILNLGLILNLRDIEIGSSLILENYSEKYFLRLTEKIRFLLCRFSW